MGKLTRNTPDFTVVGCGMRVFESLPEGLLDESYYAAGCLGGAAVVLAGVRAGVSS